MVVENYGNTLNPSNVITEASLQENVTNVYNDYYSQIEKNVRETEENFTKGFLDPITDYSRYGEVYELSVTRETVSTGTSVGRLWFAAIHSVYFGNDPANITPESTATFINGMFTYSISETITDVIETTTDNRLTIEVMRTLNIRFRTSNELMRFFGFDEQQVQWARLMHRVISGEINTNEHDYIYNEDTDFISPKISNNFKNYA